MDQCRLITEGRSDIQEDSSASVNEQLSYRFWNCKRSKGVTQKKKNRRKQASAQVPTQVFLKKIKIQIVVARSNQHSAGYRTVPPLSIYKELLATGN
jgi:hypothetical protein